MPIGTVGIAGCLDASGDTPTATTTPTPSDGDDTPAGTGSPTDTPTPTPTVDPANIDFSADDGPITECGTTCRTFEYTVANEGSAPARNVTATISVFTPTLDAAQVYEGDQAIGSVPVGGAKTTTKDIDPGALDATKIRRNDGHIGIRLVLEDQSDANATFTFEREID